MKFLWYFAVVAALLGVVHNVVRAEEEPAAVASVVEEVPAESASLAEVDAGVKGEGELDRETRQLRTFGFGRPIYRPRPFYGGGFYRPRPPFYGGGGFYRPPFYGGGYYRPPPPPFYGGYYRPPPFYGFYG